MHFEHHLRVINRGQHLFDVRRITGQGNIVVRTEQLDTGQEQVLEEALADLGGDVTVVRECAAAGGSD